MKKESVKIGDLNFDFTYRNAEDGLPSFEIENDASMVYVRVEKDQARNLRDLLDKFIQYVPQE